MYGQDVGNRSMLAFLQCHIDRKYTYVYSNFAVGHYKDVVLAIRHACFCLCWWTLLLYVHLPPDTPDNKISIYGLREYKKSILPLSNAMNRPVSPSPCIHSSSAALCSLAWPWPPDPSPSPSRWVRRPCKDPAGSWHRRRSHTPSHQVGLYQMC